MSTDTEDIPLPEFGQESKIKLPASDFLDLVKADELSVHRSPYPFFIDEQTLKGKAEPDRVTFENELKIFVLHNDWITCPLLPRTVSVLSYQISHSLIEDSKDKKTNGYIGVVNDRHSLVTDRRGIYHVRISFAVPYLSKENKGLCLNFETTSLRNRVQFEVPQEDMLIKVEPSSDTKLEYEKGKTSVVGYFSATKQLMIRWTKKDKNIEEMLKLESVKKPRTTTVEQLTLHSVGGGVVSTFAEFKFSILHGTVNSFSIEVDNYKDKKFRILRVEGASIKKWEFRKKTYDSSDSQSENSSTLTETDEKKFIKVYLEYGVEGTYTLKVFSELEMKSMSCPDLSVPTFACLGVQRETGYMAIEATTNIEIREVNAVRLGKLDISELPKDLQKRKSNSMILGYKFLKTDHSLVLEVKKHDDVAVLVACIEEAYFLATYSAGHILHHVMLAIKNTNQDFLKVSIPENCALWSTTVAGKSVRPSVDKDKKILIPLKRSASETVFSAEIVYLASAAEMKRSGEVSMEFAIFNTPINHAYFVVYMPKDYKYGEFYGDLKETKSFTKPPTVQQLLSRDRGTTTPDYAHRRWQNHKKKIGFSSAKKIGLSLWSSAGSSQEVGALPVELSALTVGTPFKFEKLLLKDIQKPLQIAVPYKEIETKWIEKRSLFPYKTLFAGIFFAMITCLLLMYFVNFDTFSKQ